MSNEDDALTAQGRIPPDLGQYWTRGEGALRIRWGTPGDFDRCRRQLREYVRPGQLDGLCANLHFRATGSWPGEHASVLAAAIHSEMRRRRHETREG